MKRTPFFSTIIIFASLLFFMTLPFPFVIAARESFIKLSYKILSPLHSAKNYFVAAKEVFNGEIKETVRAQKNNLEIENALLVSEIELLKEQLRHYSEWQLWKEKSPVKPLAAKVIARSPTSWSSSLWIDVGEKDNELFGFTYIAKDSPVVAGSSVVGVIDHVGAKQSRVRLITDSGLVPSVRAARGQCQTFLCWQALSFLLKQIDVSTVFLGNKKEALNMLNKIKENLESSSGDFLLAKGELHGSSFPLWRSGATLLKGIGFNYDFADEAGEARDLRSGAPVNFLSGAESVPILKVGDILTTTGMDGIFPAGLPVAEVVAVMPLEEGDYCYQLEAVATAGNLEELTSVFVLPPLSSDK